ncbi:toprim domain-containing protein [Streptomyces sp. NPDC010273]|uniref:toprim domain-containing protein n=1 Tax=Streptomyces sp. NPDC010273 TaxID=3364829 RepID=UPI0036EFEC15
MTLQTLSAAQRTFFEQAASRYQADLSADTAAQDYLRTRGLLPAVATFRLGVVRNPLVGHEQYAGRLAIPYLTPAGVVNLRFRCIERHDCDGHPKYLSQPDAGTNLFNVLDLKKDSPHIVVTEGELDAMSWSLAGVPAVGSPGVDAWQKHWRRCLEDHEVVYGAGDGDKAGTKFNSFLAREVKARALRLPLGEDSNSLFVKGGADALRSLIE